MALKITKAAEPIKVDRLVICIYGAPGLGKSTLAFSAASPLLFDFDHGAYRAANRGDSVQVETWQGVTAITPDDLADYETVVVDTAGRALDLLTADIIRRNAKMGRGGALTLQGYGQLKSEFTAWLRSLRVLGKDVILIAHSSEEKNGDEIVERLDVQGGSKGEIYKSADAMGRLTLINGQRVLNFSPTDTAFGKNPGRLDPLTVPDISYEPSFLGGVVASVKDRLNELTEIQKARQSAIADWSAKIDEASTAADFNELVGKVKNVKADALPVIKGYLHKQATAKGLTYTKESGYQS